MFRHFYIFLIILFLETDSVLANPLEADIDKPANVDLGIESNAQVLTKGVSFYTETSKDLDALGLSKVWFGRNEYMKAEIGVSISRFVFKNPPKGFTQTHYFPVYGLFHIK